MLDFKYDVKSTSVIHGVFTNLLGGKAASSLHDSNVLISEYINK